MTKLNAEQIQAKFAKLKQERDDARAEVRRLEIQVARLEDGIAPTSKRVQTTQATAKKWKLLMMLGGGGILAGMFLFAFGVQEESQPMVGGGILAMVFGLCSWLAGRFGKFWFHD